MLPIPAPGSNNKPEPPPSRLGSDGGPATEGERHEDATYEGGSGAGPNDPSAVLTDSAPALEAGVEDHDEAPADDEPDTSSADEPSTEDALDDEAAFDEPDASYEDGDQDDGPEGDEPDIDDVADETTDDPSANDQGDDFASATAE